MKKMKLACTALAAVAVASPAAAQEARPGTIAQVVVTHVKPGMTQQYRQGRERHMAWHKSQNDPWSWHTWEVVSGPDTGSFVTVTFGHHWKDLDTWEAKYGEGDAADVAQNLDPHAASTTVSYFDYLADVSRPPAGQGPTRMSEVLHFRLKGGASARFHQAIARTHEAIGKTNWPVTYMWYQLWNGGEGPHYVLVLPRNSWAEMAEPEPPFPAMLGKAFGGYEAGRILADIGESTESQLSEMLVYQPRLSYAPAPR